MITLILSHDKCDNYKKNNDIKSSGRFDGAELAPLPLGRWTDAVTNGHVS